MGNKLPSKGLLRNINIDLMKTEIEIIEDDYDDLNYLIAYLPIKFLYETTESNMELIQEILYNIIGNINIPEIAGVETLDFDKIILNRVASVLYYLHIIYHNEDDSYGLNDIIDKDFIDNNFLKPLNVDKDHHEDLYENLLYEISSALTLMDELIDIELLNNYNKIASDIEAVAESKLNDLSSYTFAIIVTNLIINYKKNIFNAKCVLVYKGV